VRATRVAAIVLRQLYLIQGSWSRVVPLFAWVTVNIIMWGFTSRYLDSITRQSHALVPALLGATLLWNYFDRVMHGVTMAFFEDVWSRNFLNLFASPLTTNEYIAGLVTSSVFTSMAGLVVMTLLANLAFGLVWSGSTVAMAGFLAILFAFGVALGVAGCALVLRLGPSAEWFIWPIPAFISPFVGVFYPISTLPAWMQGVSKVLPPSYVFENLRAILHGQPWSPSDLGVGLLLAAAYVMAGSSLFARVHRSALDSGLLARYSAESIS
jgi:ABC-2 type transport system permease protein